MQPYMGLGNSLQTAQASAGGSAGGGWVELGRTTLGADTDDITVSVADKRYYMILGDAQPSGNVDGLLRVNGDTGTNYASTWSDNGAADGTQVSQAKALWCPDSDATNRFGVGYISNLSTKEKLLILQAVGESTAGAGTAPSRRETATKWANTSNAISSITFRNNQSGSFSSGSELVVLGWDPADTHTTNFWEELGSDTGDGANADLTVSGITAKKYLWIQFYADPDASWTPRMRFNSDTGSNYNDRYSIDGGADGTDLNSTGAYPGFGGALPQFQNIFMINNSANEKLGMSSMVYQNTAGAGTAPRRVESVIKWANTAAQITTIAIDSLAGTPNLSTSSYLKVWGSN